MKRIFLIENRFTGSNQQLIVLLGSGAGLPSYLPCPGVSGFSGQTPHPSNQGFEIIPFPVAITPARATALNCRGFTRLTPCRRLHGAPLSGKGQGGSAPLYRQPEARRAFHRSGKLRQSACAGGYYVRPFPA